MNKTLKSSVSITQWWFKTTRAIQRRLPYNILYRKISDGRQISVISLYISPYCPAPVLPSYKQELLDALGSALSHLSQQFQRKQKQFL